MTTFKLLGKPPSHWHELVGREIEFDVHATPLHFFRSFGLLMDLLRRMDGICFREDCDYDNYRMDLTEWRPLASKFEGEMLGIKNQVRGSVYLSKFYPITLTEQDSEKAEINLKYVGSIT
jgi:hypothetical protein